jgi:hypothetical protein
MHEREVVFRGGRFRTDFPVHHAAHRKAEQRVEFQQRRAVMP